MTWPLPRHHARPRGETLRRLGATVAVLTALTGCATPVESARHHALVALDASRHQAVTARVSVRFDHGAGTGALVETAQLTPGWQAATITAAAPSRLWRTITLDPRRSTRITPARGPAITAGAQLRWGMNDTLALTPWLVGLAATPEWGLGAVHDAGRITVGGIRARRLVAALDPSRIQTAARHVADALSPAERAQLEAERRAGQRWLPGGQLELAVRGGRVVALILRDERRPAGPLSVLIELQPRTR